MPQSNSSTQVCIAKLILIPSVITLAITILRLVGELQHWSQVFFRSSAGGAGAIVGIAWLPLLFGPYFSVKLAGAGEGPSSAGKSLGFAFLSFAIFVAGGFVAFTPPMSASKFLIGLVIMVAGAVVTFPGWGKLSKTLLAYAYAARIPVAIVMFLAIRGNWGTHYDAVGPRYKGPMDFWSKYTFIGLVPQLIMWVAYTLVVGALFGSMVAAVARRGKAAAQPASS